MMAALFRRPASALGTRALRRLPRTAPSTVDRAAYGRRPLRASAGGDLPSVRAFASKETVRMTYVDPAGEEFPVDAEVGKHLLDVAHDHDIELEGACGGELACSTCHLVFEEEVFSSLPTMDDEEEDMLDLAMELTETSRLGCQIRVTKEFEGITVRIPDDGY